MGRRSLAWILLLSSCISLPLLAQQAGPERVTILPTAAGFTLWLPGRVSTREQVAVLGVVNRFSRTWGLFFRTPPSMPDPLVVPSGPDLRKGVFSSLWRQAALALDPAEQAGVQEAFRFLVLDDAIPLLDHLARAVGDGRLQQLPLTAPLLYVFLKESVSESGFLPQALPPGPDGGRLAEALASRGISQEHFRNRYASWLLSRAVESRLIKRPQATLPAVWMLDSDLAPGETAGWRFTLEDGESGLDLEAAGSPSPGLLILGIYSDEAGRPVHSSLWEAGEGRAILPRQGSDLWLFLWNTGDQSQGAGLTLTLWKESRPPFAVLQASLSGTSCDVLLGERPGVADYEVTPIGASAQPEPAPLRFRSDGEGLNHYHLRLDSRLPQASALRISCRTTAGGTYATEIPLGESREP